MIAGKGSADFDELIGDTSWPVILSKFKKMAKTFVPLEKVRLFKEAKQLIDFILNRILPMR